MIPVPVDEPRFDAEVGPFSMPISSLRLAQASGHGRVHLRVMIINPLTTEQDLYALQEAVRLAARKLA